MIYTSCEQLLLMLDRLLNGEQVPTLTVRSYREPCLSGAKVLPARTAARHQGVTDQRVESPMGSLECCSCKLAKVLRSHTIEDAADAWQVTHCSFLRG